MTKCDPLHYLSQRSTYTQTCPPNHTPYFQPRRDQKKWNILDYPWKTPSGSTNAWQIFYRQLTDHLHDINKSTFGLPGSEKCPPDLCIFHQVWTESIINLLSNYSWGGHINLKAALPSEHQSTQKA